MAKGKTKKKKKNARTLRRQTPRRRASRTTVSRKKLPARIPSKKRGASKPPQTKSRPWRTWEIWIPIHVEDVARDKAVRSVVQRRLYDWHDWPLVKRDKREPFWKTRPKRWKPFDVRERHRTVEATIIVDSYLTSDVPEAMRRRVYKVRGPGDCLVRAADMYLRIYRENAKLGGEAVYPDLDKRMTKRRRQKIGLINRGFEPYVWGHDLEDLVFEGLLVKWTSDDRTTCEVRFMIGS